MSKIKAGLIIATALAVIFMSYVFLPNDGTTKGQLEHMFRTVVVPLFCVLGLPLVYDKIKKRKKSRKDRM